MPCFYDSVERYKSALYDDEQKKFFDADKNDSDRNHFKDKSISETAVPVSSKLISVHLNFMEGECLAGKEKVPHLVDENGYFNVSWLKLLLWSYIPFVCGKIKKELSSEIIFQTQRILDCGLADKEHLRFDSHQHPHMIPVVFDSLLSAIEEKKWKVDFIRNAQEILHSYMRVPALYKTYSLANIVKCVILNLLSFRVRRKLKKIGLHQSYLCGVFFSGKMDKERLDKVLPSILKKCKNKNRGIEILFHQGLVLKSELDEAFSKPGFNEFHLSSGRKTEFSAVNEFKGSLL